MAIKSNRQLGKYHLTEELYVGERTLVYRAVPEAEETMGQSVILKLLRQEYPTFNELLQFRNQYTITKNLDIPGIIRPYHLGSYRNSYVLVMEDFGGISLANYTKNTILSVREVLEIAQQLANILDQLHQNHVIHKDIKPGNILIHPETKNIKLIDFSIASLLPKETQEIKNPNGLEGTLAYIAPEQTGRMNRGIDYRADFYCLGVTLFQLLTGRLPFLATDPMELLHCHLAKQPPNIHSLNEEIPPIISVIVDKLMAKNAEDRYQSALGLKYDLENCLQQLETTGKIDNFPLGTRDISDRFLIPEKLYGRELEVKTLLEGFNRVAKGTAELMLVAGFSGIGKTAVINEIHKPIVRERGYFIKGKFDQFNRNIPFSAFVQSFRDLMRQFLSESDVKLAEWRTKILQAVGENGQVIIDVIPELESLIGKQPAATELSGNAAQNRFNLLFPKFVQVFTSKEHPLVIFLDDWQWSDSASMNLLKLLMRDTEYLLILGAYRDNEVSPVHPFILTVEGLKKTEKIVNTITLEPLSQTNINQLVADTLNCDLLVAQPLTALVYEKTQGNPFFATQFLKAMYEEKFIQFNPELSYWQCDISQIKVQSLTDNVVEFMAQQLQKLPPKTQEILKLAACIGAQFNLNTLSIVSEKSEVEVATNLWKSLQEGLILPTNQTYKFYQDETISQETNENVKVTYQFLHDRVQQAAYSLIPDNQKQQTHYHIGQLLLEQNSSEAREDRIFELVNQLNYGISLITDQTAREQLAQLNLTASHKARTATAYQAAREYIDVGLSILGETAWEKEYEMTLAFHELAAEVALLCGEFERMEKFIDVVLDQAKSLVEKANVYRIKIQANALQNRAPQALAIGQNILEQLGVNFPETLTPKDFQQKSQEIAALIGDKEIANFVDLPLMTDVEKLAIIQIIISIIPAAYVSGSPLFPLLVLLAVQLCIQYGNPLVSSYIYISYGVILCNLLQDVDTGSQFGKLALNVLAKQDAKFIKSEVLFVHGAYILHRQSHIKATLPFLQEGYTAGVEVGSLDHAGYSANHFCLNSFWCGNPITNLEQDARNYTNILRQLNQFTAANWCQLSCQSLLNLQGMATHPTILSGEAMEETESLALLLSTNDFLGLSLFYTYKLMLCFWFGEIEQANNYGIEGRRYLMAAGGMVVEPGFYLYDSLIALAQLNENADQILAALERVEDNQRRLQQDWAHHAPMNHQHKFDLVEAEKSRILGEKSQAIELYDRAISGAKENEYIQEEALANELAAKFYLNWGKQKIAADYMQAAYYCYARWGAKAKVADLENRYPLMLAPILQQTRSSLSTKDTLFSLATVAPTKTANSSSSSISGVLDLATILKASQTLSGEIELEKLLSKLLHIVIENAGADKCAFLFVESDRLVIQASAKLSLSADQNQITKVEFYPVINPQPVEESVDLPVSLINTVKRSCQAVIINDATLDQQLINDPYIQEQEPKSILCSPIFHQGKLMGILYLENNLATGAFTSDRVELLNLICTQVAISLENARLYKNEKEKSQVLQEAAEELAQFQAKLMFLIQTTPMAVIEWNSKFEVVSWNPSAEKMFGYKASEMINNHAFEIVPEADQPHVLEIMTNLLEQTGGIYSVNENITKDGKLIICEWINTPLVDENGTSMGIYSMVQDITERKRSEALITQKSQELEKALQDLQTTQLQMIQSEKMSALGNLIAGVAHEINNPVGFIRGNIKPALEYINDLFKLLDLIQAKNPELDPEIEKEIEVIDLEYIREDLPKLIGSMQEGVKRIQDISTSLRTFSRADSDRPVACNIHDGIDSTIMILKHRLKANDLRPEIQVIKEYGDLPQIECYAGQLNQVFMNILSNAIDALEDSNQGVIYAKINNQITIKTDLSTHKKEVIIRIKDNGIGMGQELQNKIFENLFTTKGVGKGTGLGLAISRQIIEEQHHGKITVNSAIGMGTEFIIWLPTR